MKTLLLIIAIAGILFFAYRKVADYHFKKGYLQGELDYHRKVNPREDKNNTSVGGSAIIDKSFGVPLEKWQLQYIEQCKAEGMMGCYMTINNQQSYVSFYKNAYEP